MRPKSVKHKTCARCLEPSYSCVCLPADLEEYERPEVAWVARRSLKPPSVIQRLGKYRYEKASQEVERLNKQHAGSMLHFLLPVN